MADGSERRIPALKLFVSQLSRARETVGSSGNNNLLGLQLLGVEFTRVWLQGIVVEVDPTTRSFVVDDGTGTVTAISRAADDGAEMMENNSNINAGDSLPETGQHVLLVGPVEAPLDGQQQRSSCSRYRLLYDVIKDVGSESPNRETLWGLEVVDLWTSRPQSSQG